MKDNETRVLARILAVVEIGAVSGAKCTLPEYDTSCTETNVTSDSGTASDTGATADSGTASDTGATADSGTASDTSPSADTLPSRDTRPVFDMVLEY